jgi:hypothetical protein
MARISVDIIETTLTNDNGIEVASVCATCSQCGQDTESFGTSEASVRRCLVLLREKCPSGENNFYMAEEGD